MKRQVTWPGRPVASRIAASVAALTLSWNPSNRSQVIAVSNVSLMIAAPDHALARIGHADEGVAPAPRRALAMRVAPPARSGVPPWSAQHSSARFIHGSTGWSADSKASTMIAALPSPAPVL